MGIGNRSATSRGKGVQGVQGYSTLADRLNDLWIDLS